MTRVIAEREMNIRVPCGVGKSWLCRAAWTLVLASCRSAGPTVSTPDLARSAASAESPARPLPAGTHFRGYDTCGQCDAPTHAVVAGIVDTPVAAEAAIAALSRVPSDPGYPLVVHTDELGLVDTQRGVAIVLGLFADGDAASAWLVHAGTSARVVALEGQAWAPSTDAPTRVVRIAVPTAKAYDRRAVLQIEAELEEREWNTLVDRQQALRERVLALAPTCTLAQGSIQLWTPRGDDGLRWYQWAPVRCGDTDALVAWRDTWLDSSVVPTGDGEHIVVQVTGAECDTPLLAHWPWSRTGKGVGEPTKPLVARGEC